MNLLTFVQTLKRKKLLVSMGFKKIKGIWLKKDEKPSKSSSKPKRVKTHATKKTPPPRKARRMTIIKQNSLDKSLNEEFGSTKDPAPQTFVDLEFYEEEEVPPKELSPERLALSLSLKVEEEENPVTPPPAPENPLTSQLTLEKVLQEAENRYRRVVCEEIYSAIAALQGKSTSRPKSF